MSEESNYGIDVTNFGPINSASITLRPFTVFIGPSNTGKSYLAILLYALHRCFGNTRRGWRPGFPRSWHSGRTKGPDESVKESLIAWAGGASLEPGKTSTKQVADYIQGELQRAANHSLQRELSRCFGVERLNSLARRQDSREGAKVELTAFRSNGTQGGGSYAVTLGQPKKELSGTVSGIDTLLIDTKRAADLLSEFREIFLGFGDNDEIDTRQQPWIIRELVEICFLNLFGPVHRDAYYLPADRTGVMHSHQVVVSTLVQNAASAGIRRSREIPMLSGVLADFLSELIEMSGRRGPGRRKQVDRGERLEKQILDGAVRLQRAGTDYPVFAYRPWGWKDDLPLMRASSMVSELAPVVLYLRHLVDPDNVLIIEEPESHLHPAMQAAFARELARLVRDGVRIVMTTHSEWFLEQIGNLVRLSGLSQSQREDLEDADCALRPDQVGAWLFKPSELGSGSVVEEIGLDEETGLYPTDYDVVSEMLYNQGAAIFNRTQAANGS